MSISIKAHSQLSTKLAIVGTPNSQESQRVSAIFTDSNHLRAKDAKLENVMVVALLVLVVVAIIATIVIYVLRAKQVVICFLFLIKYFEW